MDKRVNNGSEKLSQKVEIVELSFEVGEQSQSEFTAKYFCYLFSIKSQIKALSCWCRE